MAPAQWGQQCHCDNGKDAFASMMATTSSGQGQQHQLDNGNDAIATRATMLLQWWQRHLDCNDICTSTMSTPSQQGQQCQLDDSKDTCALMTATTPFLQGQQCQLDDYTSLTTAETREKIAIAMTAKTPVHQQQTCHRNKGNNAIAMMARMAANQWWQWHHCNKGDDARLRTATMPLWRGQQRCHGSRATTPLLQGQQCQLDNGKDTCASTMVRQSQLWQWQRHMHIDSNNVITTRATMPAWQQAARATTLAWQRQRCLCIDNGNTAIMTRTTSAITTMAKMSAHWQQGCHHNEGNDTRLMTSNKGDNTSLMMAKTWQQPHCNDGKDPCASMMMTFPLQQGQWHQLEDGNNTIATMATMPPRIKGNDAIVTRATMPAHQWQGCLRNNNGNNNIVMGATIAITTTTKMQAHWQQ
jgi:hypothetical protein